MSTNNDKNEKGGKERSASDNSRKKSQTAGNRSPGPDRESEFSYVINEHIGILRTSPTGWTKELNLITWNDNPTKYDIREWSENHDKMSKGVTLTEEEAEILWELLGSRGFERVSD